MIRFAKRSGNIDIIDRDDGYYTVTLDDYIGTIVPDSSVEQLKIIVYGTSIILNAIQLHNHNNLDLIRVAGDGSVTFKELKATTIEIQAETSCSNIIGNVVRVTNASLLRGIYEDDESLVPTPVNMIEAISEGTWNGIAEPGPSTTSIPISVIRAIANGTWDGQETSGDVPEDTVAMTPTYIDSFYGLTHDQIRAKIAQLIAAKKYIKPFDISHLDQYESNGEIFIQATGHIWIIDSTCITAGYEYCIASPFVLLRNASTKLYGEKVFETIHEISLEFCNVLTQTTSQFICQAQVLDSDGKPDEFVYKVVKDSDGNHTIYTRRETFSYIPMQKGTPYNKFKDATGYTNVNLHAHVDQNAIIRRTFKDFGSFQTDALHDILAYVYTDVDNSLRPIPLDVIRAIASNTWDGQITSGIRGAVPIPVSMIDAKANGTWDYIETEGEVPQDTNSISSSTIQNLSIYNKDTIDEYRRQQRMIIHTPLYNISQDVIKNRIYIICDLYKIDINDDDAAKFASQIWDAIISDEYNIYAGLEDVYNDYAINEVLPRKYEEGIYSLNAYRTTDIQFHDDADRYDERP